MTALVKHDPVVATSGQDDIVAHCAFCDTTYTVSVHLGGSYSEAAVWKAAAPQLKQAGWDQIKSYEGQSTLICPLCVHRRAHPVALPKFSGVNCTCPKCGTRDVTALFESAIQERMRRRCGKCGFGWLEAVKRRPWWKLW